MTETIYRQSQPHPDDFAKVAVAYRHGEITLEQFSRLLVAWRDGVSFFGLEELLKTAQQENGR